MHTTTTVIYSDASFVVDADVLEEAIELVAEFGVNDPDAADALERLVGSALEWETGCPAGTRFDGDDLIAYVCTRAELS